jgi:hypothetical protein
MEAVVDNSPSLLQINATIMNNNAYMNILEQIISAFVPNPETKPQLVLVPVRK